VQIVVITDMIARGADMAADMRKPGVAPGLALNAETPDGYGGFG
jgi:hypothetical protein